MLIANFRNNARVQNRGGIPHAPGVALSNVTGTIKNSCYWECKALWDLDGT